MHPAIRRILAPNPGAMTGPGTNTYIVGTGRVAIIDPGPALDDHLSAILAALHPDETISHILVTHTHLDHSALALRLAQVTGAATAGFGPFVATSAMPDGGEGIDHAFVPDLRLAHGDVLQGNDWQVQALYTPGHAANHLCFAAGNVLFSGDQVMGWSTSLISPPDGCMRAYMASLAALQSGNWQIAYPGHGAPITDVPARLTELITHRRTREAAILAALKPSPMLLTILTTLVYTGLAPALLPAAMRNVLAHVIDLQSRNLVTTDNLLQPDPLISLT